MAPTRQQAGAKSRKFRQIRAAAGSDKHGRDVASAAEDGQGRSPASRAFVIPGLVPGIHPPTSADASHTLDPGNKCRDDKCEEARVCEKVQPVPVFRVGTSISLVQILNVFKTCGPKVLISGTSVASRPRATTMRPM